MCEYFWIHSRSCYLEICSNSHNIKVSSIRETSHFLMVLLGIIVLESIAWHKYFVLIIIHVLDKLWCYRYLVVF